MKDAKGHGSNAHNSGILSATDQNHVEIHGVKLIASKDSKGAWVAKTEAGKTVSQQYKTRPQMWDDLQRVAATIGPERFKRDIA